MFTRPVRQRRRLGLAAIVLVVVGVAAACEPNVPAVEADPSLYPTFQNGVTDYVNRCDPSSPTDVRVTAPSGMTVSIDGQTARSGTFTAQVNQVVGDRFTIRVTSDGSTRTHHVRCLPLDFPQWRAELTGTPQSQFYTTVAPLSFGANGNYGIVFDTNGVPVWWTRNRIPTALFTLLPNRHFAVDRFFGPAEEIGLDGSVVRTINTVGGESDFHDVILLPNGNYVLATAQEEENFDLSAWGRTEPATVINHDFQILTPAGEVVWSWNAAEHIPVNETTSTWRAEREPLTGLDDPWHYNSVEWTGDGFIISFRHLDALYKIDYPSGEIAWKLGGTPRVGDSLSVRGDGVFSGGGNFSGQHDGRLQPDGTVTLFDNGTRQDRDPRSVRYRLDLTARTATLLEEITDPLAPVSFCCGSSRRLPRGNWVTGWGGTGHITEQRPDGSRVYRLDLSPTSVYRGVPIAFGQLSPSALRAGMDAQYE